MGNHNSTSYAIGLSRVDERLRCVAGALAADAGGRVKPDEPVRMKRCGATSPIILGLCLFVSACTSVDTILLTHDTFPPKESADEVAVLERTPTRPHRDLAELRIGESWLSFRSLQHKILNRAAALGADAVVFTQRQTQTTHRVAYEPFYGSWGYNSPYYGSPWGYGMYGGLYGGWSPWGGGLYSGSIAVPHDETLRLLMGTAVRYTDAAGVQHDRATGAPGL